MAPIRSTGSPIGSRPAQATQPGEKKAATTTEKATPAPASGGWLKPATQKPQPKPVTTADVAQSPELATRYSLHTGHLPFLSTEEVMEFAQHNLDAAKGANVERPGTLAGNLIFALNELESRLPNGSKLRAQLYAARQGLHGGKELGDGLTKPAVAKAMRAITAFAKSEKIDPASSKWDPRVFAPAAQITRFRMAMQSLDHGLWGSYAGAPPNARQLLKNTAAELNVELPKVTLPTEPNAKKVFARAVRELSVIMESVVKGAEKVRPDIAASGKQALETLQRFGQAVAD